jgi:hypothetical protein
VAVCGEVEISENRGGLMELGAEAVDDVLVENDAGIADDRSQLRADGG